MGRAVFLLAALAVSCGPAPLANDESELARARQRMVAEQIEARGVKSALVLNAMRTVPRHEFVPAAARHDAYGDHPLPIGHGQTISQPYIVGFMTDALGLVGGEKVLEVGTGSGYQSAVLAQMASAVYSIEIVAPLAEEARERMARLGYRNVFVRAGDGYKGWPEAAPFDAIVVTAAAPRVPEPLKEQLKDGGRLVIPWGGQNQELVVLTRHGGTFAERHGLSVTFLPMSGDARE